MSRAISASLLQNLLDQSSEEGLLPLLTIDWNDGPHVGTLRFAVHDEDITDGPGAQTFTAADFGVELPDEDDTDIPMLRITVQDPDLMVRTELRQLDSRFPASATLQLVLLSDHDNVQQSFSGVIRATSFTRVLLSASVELYEDISRAPATPYKMSPAYGFNSLRAVD